MYKLPLPTAWSRGQLETVNHYKDKHFNHMHIHFKQGCYFITYCFFFGDDKDMKDSLFIIMTERDRVLLYRNQSYSGGWVHK